MESPNTPPRAEQPETAVDRVLACTTGHAFIQRIRSERERTGMSMVDCRNRLMRIALDQAIEVAETPGDFRKILKKLAHATYS